MTRRKDQTTITISLSVDLLSRIDDRAARLEMDRSTYLRQLCLRDEGGVIYNGNIKATQFVGRDQRVAETPPPYVRDNRGKKK